MEELEKKVKKVVIPWVPEKEWDDILIEYLEGIFDHLACFFLGTISAIRDSLSILWEKRYIILKVIVIGVFSLKGLTMCHDAVVGSSQPPLVSSAPHKPEPDMPDCKPRDGEKWVTKVIKKLAEKGRNINGFLIIKTTENKLGCRPMKDDKESKEDQELKDLEKEEKKANIEEKKANTKKINKEAKAVKYRIMRDVSATITATTGTFYLLIKEDNPIKPLEEKSDPGSSDKTKGDGQSATPPKTNNDTLNKPDMIPTQKAMQK